MSFNSKAAEVATRAGAVQTAVAPKVKTTKEADAARRDVYYGNDESDESAGSAFSQPSATGSSRFTAADKKLRRETRRRRQELRTQNDNTEVGRNRGSEEATRTGKKTDKTEIQKNRRGPEPTAADRGLRTAQELLHQNSLLQQASLKFEQSRQAPSEPSSPFGQQQAMLDSLISMTEMLYHQHTGDKAGEIYNRPATRQILTALKGLKDAAQPRLEQSDEVAAPVRKKKKKEFRAQMARLEKMQTVVFEPPVPPADYEPLDLVA